MSRNKVKIPSWQISLKMLFGLFAIFGIEIWVCQQGLEWSLFVPLILAAFFQVTGHPVAADYAGIATIVFWLSYPFVSVVVQGIDS